MAIAATKPMTATEFSQLDLDVPVELVRGEIIEMPRPGMLHSVIANNCGVLLALWSRANKNVYFVGNDAGVLTERDPDTVRGPDVFAIAKNRLPDGAVVSGFLETAPDLCVEVMSPHDSWKELVAKVHEYLQAGVREIWVIDPEERRLHCYRPDASPRVYHDGEVFDSVALTGCRVEMSDVFHDVSA